MEDQAGCSCLPFCFWSSKSKRPEQRRRRRGFRLRLSWFSWPWLRKSGGKKKAAAGKNKGRRRRMLLMLFRSSSGSSSLLPKMSSFSNARKQSRRKTRLPVDDAAPTTSASQAPPPARPGTTSQTAGAVCRAPSRLHSLEPDRGAPEPCACGLWTMATTLGVIIFFGRVTAVIFLCSCLYGARFAAAHAGGGGKTECAGGGSRRLGDPVAVGLCAQEHKKKVVMEGLLDRGHRRAFVDNQQQLGLL